MQTISDVDQTSKLITHLVSEDFFAVNKYPESKLIITKSEFLNSENNIKRYKVAGDLTIKDKTNSIDFIALIQSQEQSLVANAKFFIDRTQWDIKYGSGQFFSELRDNIIKDEIEYNIEIIAKLIQ